MTKHYNFKVSEDQNKTRLDKFITSLIQDFSRSKVKQVIDNGCTKVNHEIKKDASYLVRVGDEIEIEIKEVSETKLKPKKIPFEVVFEDKSLLVINKPAGLTVHPGAGNYEDTLVNALLAYCGKELSSIGGSARPGIVHRLDKNTSGLMVVAKNDLVHAKLSQDLSERLIKRKYYALVYGCFDQLRGTIKTYMGKSKKDRKRMTVRYESGKLAVTHYQIIKKFYDTISLVECILDTGRTHQIRVHMEHKKHPIIGDPVYGRALNFNLNKVPVKAKEMVANFKRQALHARSLEFIHPISGEEMQFEISLPVDMQKLIDVLEEGE